MEADKKRALQRLIDTGYIPQLQALAKSLSAPFWWHEDFDENAPPKQTVRHNGTICFVRTGQRTIGITAAHVYDEYLKDLKADPSLLCQLGSASFDPRERLIDRDGSIDLATFDVPEIVVNQSGSNLHAPASWPPSEAIEGSLVLLGGWPASHRSERPGKLDIHFASFITKVDQASSEHLGIALNVTDGVSSGDLVLPSSPDLGGASGGPVFAIQESPVVTLAITGFLYQYHRSFEIARARHASVVAADGTLIRQGAV